jgi:hypothetical protein
MMVKTQRADEVADFASCLGDIDDIFFQSAQRVIFAVKKKSKRFERGGLVGTLTNTTVAFLSHLIPMGVRLGILLAA